MVYYSLELFFSSLRTISIVELSKSVIFSIFYNRKNDKIDLRLHYFRIK